MFNFDSINFIAVVNPDKKEFLAHLHFLLSTVLGQRTFSATF